MNIDREARPEASNLDELAALDLNKVTDEENRQAKMKMNIFFDKNRIDRNDDKFEYDKRVEFDPPAAASDWDEE